MFHFQIYCNLLLLLFLYQNMNMISADNSNKILRAKAYKSVNKYPLKSEYPENSLKELNNRPSTGISFSGGGSRSFTASIGYLSALNDLNLIKNIKYINGISGGSWAASVFTYAQNIIDNDKILLGEIIPPNEIKEISLNKIDSNCVRKLTQNALAAIAAEALKNKIVNNFAESYTYGVYKSYLEPIGIPQNTRFSWSEEIVNDIKLRNNNLLNETFILPNNNKRPFMILGTSLVGPTEGAPYHSDAHNFTMLEITPLYTGQMYNLDVTYINNGIIHNKFINKPIKKHIGGAIETYAFNVGMNEEKDINIAPTLGLNNNMNTGILNVPSPNNFMDLQWAAGSSGYAIGAFMESSYIPTADDKLGLHYQYWSPSESKPSSTDMLYTDGGCYENFALLPMIQRQVSKIILFINPHTPLQPSENWNVDTDAPNSDQIDSGISSFFGILPPLKKEAVERNFMMEKNQIFKKEEYNILIKGLQAAQKVGKGIIYTMNLTTIENNWWGIPNGITSEITFVYLGRLSQWESKLSSDMQSKIIPTDGNPNDLSNTIDDGDFKHFPHYKTAGGLLTAKQTNLLADMSGWSILENKELFERILS